MALERMPNGQIVDIAESVSGSDRARIRAEYSARIRASTASETEVQPAKTKRRKQTFGERMASGMHDTEGQTGRVIRSATFGVLDRVQDAVGAGIDTVTGEGSLVDNYKRNKAFSSSLRQSRREHSPYQSLAEEIAGAILSPVGAGTGAARILTKIAPKAKLAIDASRVGKLAAKLGNHSVGLGARAGFNDAIVRQAINGEGSLQDRVTEAAVEGGGGGAAAGAIFGIGGKVATTLANRADSNALRVAMSKVKNALTRSIDPETRLPYTAQSARNEIVATDKSGGDGMLMDLAPEMRNMSGYLASKPGLAAATDLETRVQDRSLGASDRFNKRVRKDMGEELPAHAPDLDAHEFMKASKEARQASGKEGWAEGGAFDVPLKNTPEVDRFFNQTPPEFDVAVKSAYTQMLNRGEIPVEEAGSGSFTHLPNLRALDYVKRHYDGIITEALRSGNTTKAGELSWQLGHVKKTITDSSPGVADEWAKQRDAFQEYASAELGKNFLKQLGSDPRKLMDMIRKEGMQEEPMLIGMADALLQMDLKTGNPVAAMRKYLRNEHSRKVLLYMFKSNKKLSEFEKFIKREIRTRKTDNIVDPTTGSKTNVLRSQIDDDDEISAGVGLFKKGLQGLAYGGTVGLSSGVLRGLDTLSSGLGVKAQEELAGILSGKGDDLAEGFRKVDEYDAVSEKLRRRRAISAGKGASVVTND